MPKRKKKLFLRKTLAKKTVRSSTKRIKAPTRLKYQPRKKDGRFANKRLRKVKRPLQLTFAGATLASVILFVGLTTGLLSSYLSLNKSAANATGQPNIVVLLTDDEPALDGRLMNWLPTMKSMFKDQGVSLTDFHSSNNLCCPGRATYLTGQLSHNHNVLENNFTPFNPSMTIATQLQSVGYHTMLAGKYLNGYNGGGKPLGWDSFTAFGGGAEYYKYDLWVEGTQKVSYGTGAANYSTDILAQKAAAQIDSAPVGKPILSWIGVYATHDNLTPAPRHNNVDCENTKWKPPNWNEANVSDKPAWMRNSILLSNPETLTKRCRTLKSVDDLMVSVKAALARTNRLDNTLFVYISDNGNHMGEHRLTRKVAPHNSRIPFYMHWPARFGTTPYVSNEYMTGLALAPTLCEVAGCTLGPYPNGQATPDGQSFLSLLPDVNGNPNPQPMPQYADYPEEMPAGGNAGANFSGDVPPWYGVVTTKTSPLAFQGCIQSGSGGCRWQYIQYPTTGERELYDISNGPCWSWSTAKTGDPCKLNNQASNPAYAAIVTQLEARVNQYKIQHGL